MHPTVTSKHRRRRRSAGAALAASTVAALGIVLPAAADDGGEIFSHVSDLDWSSTTGEVARDESIATGGWLTLPDGAYGAGIGMRAPASVAFAVPDGRTCSVTAGVGLDPAADDDAEASFEIRGDGQVLASAGPVGEGEIAYLDADVTGVTEVELRAVGDGVPVVWASAAGMHCEAITPEAVVVVPESPTFADLPGRHGWGEYTIPEMAGLQYFRQVADGEHVPVAAGTYEATGRVFIHAVADDDLEEEYREVEYREWQHIFSADPGGPGFVVERDARGERPVEVASLEGTVGAIMAVQPAPVCSPTARVKVYGAHFQPASDEGTGTESLPIHSTSTGGTATLTAVDADGGQEVLAEFAVPGEDALIRSEADLARWVPGGGPVGVDDADGYHSPEPGTGWYGTYSTTTLGFAIGHDELPIPADTTEVRFTYAAPDGRAVEQVMLTAGAKACEDSEWIPEPDPVPEPEVTPEPELELEPPVRERPDPPVAVPVPRLAE